MLSRPSQPRSGVVQKPTSQPISPFTRFGEGPSSREVHAFPKSNIERIVIVNGLSLRSQGVWGSSTPLAVQMRNAMNVLISNSPFFDLSLSVSLLALTSRPGVWSRSSSVGGSKTSELVGGMPNDAGTDEERDCRDGFVTMMGRRSEEEGEGKIVDYRG